MCVCVTGHAGREGMLDPWRQCRYGGEGQGREGKARGLALEEGSNYLEMPAGGRYRWGGVCVCVWQGWRVMSEVVKNSGYKEGMGVSG